MGGLDTRMSEPAADHAGISTLCEVVNWKDQVWSFEENDFRPLMVGTFT